MTVNLTGALEYEAQHPRRVRGGLRQAVLQETT